MINENDYEGAIELVARSWSKDEEKQLTFLSIIATG
jgi:antitoxin component HigA of HigAB toxin-antitoxin module